MGGYGRKSIPDKCVPFIEMAPLALKNKVRLSAGKDTEKACLTEMMEVIGCLSKFDQNQSMCQKEIGSFNSCFKTFRKDQAKAKAFKESGEVPVGRHADLTGEQLNNHLKKFMQGSRKRQFHNDKVYKNLS